MTPLYFQFLQMVAGFIVQAVKIDKDKDGAITGAEIFQFVNVAILPLILNANSVKNQFQAFSDHIKSIGLAGLKQSIMDVVAYQLLPDELRVAEAKVDAIAEGVYMTITGVEKTIQGVKDAFGGKEVVVTFKD